MVELEIKPKMMAEFGRGGRVDFESLFTHVIEQLWIQFMGQGNMRPFDHCNKSNPLHAASSLVS